MGIFLRTVKLGIQAIISLELPSVGDCGASFESSTKKTVGRIRSVMLDVCCKLAQDGGWV